MILIPQTTLNMDNHNLLIIPPLLILLLSAVLCLFFWKYVKIQRIIYLIGTAVTLCSSVFLLISVAQYEILTLQVGSWTAPFGISLVVDIFSALMVSITALLGFSLFFYSFARESIDLPRKKVGFYPVLLFMLTGIIGAFITGDIFNLYVWFEVMLVSSFVLITLGNERSQLEGAIKYVTINFVASTFFLLGIGILYGIAGSTNMADLASKLQEPEISNLADVASMVFMVSFGIKAAIFPLFFWLPASYHTPPVAITAIIAGLLTKVGVYALIRTFTLIFPLNTGFSQLLLLALTALTMIIGVLGAIAQDDLRRILSFHIISQIGYMIMGLAIFSPLALAGSIFYIIHHILVKTNLFFISGIVERYQGSYTLKDLGGIYDKLPFVSLLFAISAFSLAGIPPLSGFWGKYILAKAGLDQDQYSIVAASLLTGLLTLFSMSKIWRQAFLQSFPEHRRPVSEDREIIFVKNNKGMVTASVILAGFTLWLSFFAAPLVELSEKAADQLLNRELYIKNVLNNRMDE